MSLTQDRSCLEETTTSRLRLSRPDPHFLSSPAPVRRRASDRGRDTSVPAPATSQGRAVGVGRRVGVVGPTGGGRRSGVPSSGPWRRRVLPDDGDRHWVPTGETGVEDSGCTPGEPHSLPRSSSSRTCCAPVLLTSVCVWSLRLSAGEGGREGRARSLRLCLWRSSGSPLPSLGGHDAFPGASRTQSSTQSRPQVPIPVSLTPLSSVVPPLGVTTVKG